MKLYHDSASKTSNNFYFTNNISNDPFIDSKGNTRLMLAVLQLRIDLIKLFIEKEHVDINKQNFTGESALLLACQNNFMTHSVKVQLVRYLIRCGANIQLSNLDGNTALHYSSGFGDESLVNLLIQQGAFINSQNEKGETALHWAVMNGMISNVDILLKSGEVLIDLKNENGLTAVDLALEKEDKTILCKLVDFKEKTRREYAMDIDEESLGWTSGRCSILESSARRIMDDGRALSTNSNLLWWM